MQIRPIETSYLYALLPNNNRFIADLFQNENHHLELLIHYVINHRLFTFKLKCIPCSRLFIKVFYQQ